ncbi:restriction endonuclease subunit S [Serratia marcescens]|uniref:restriction endonuclease subunit S n=1 Tax=Serratia marcescens TaxID=615 RepID=UPI002B263BD2|nr:restriction endonuclease subunit S [Serratia marcescens]WPJ24432.1 restriction endonuclease subunit S [Serratia marcescens]
MARTNLESFRLKERCSIKSSKRIFAREYVDFGIPFWRSKDVIDKSLGVFDNFDLYISKERFGEIADKFGSPRKNDLLISSVGNRAGQPYVVQDEGDFYFKDGNILWVSEFENLDPEFLAYWLKSSNGQLTLSSIMIGSAQKALTIDALRNLEVSMPSYSAQLNAVKSLKLLDCKIALNRQINKTLEQMAQALFKSWFVDFDPVVDNALDAGFFEQDLEFSDELLRRVEVRKVVRESADFKPLPEHIRQLFPTAFEKCSEPSLGLGGWVPEGWKVKILGEITSELRRGISPKYIEEGGVQVINQKCIRNHEVSYEAARRHDQETKRIDGRALKLGDVLVNSTGVGTLGRIAQVTHLSETTVADSHVTVVRVSDNACPIFTFGQLMLSMETLIERLGEGSTGQTELSRKILSEQFVVLPPSDIAEKAERSFKSFSEKQESNRQQNSELIKLRDTLLPKLISGELCLSDSEADTADEVLA